MRVTLGKITHPEGAELQLDTAPADWIADRLLPWGADFGTRVCAIVPVGYEAYLRVFHHAEEHVGSESIRRRWSALAQQSGRQMHPAVPFDRFAWPNPPQEGSLDRQEATALVSLLRTHTTTPKYCWLAIWHGFGQLTGSVQVHAVGGRGLRAWLQQRRVAGRVAPPRDLAAAPTVSLPNREYFLYRGPIDVVPRFEHLPGHLQTPNMWWPEDRAWFVATEIDFDSTLVACTRACGAALLGSDLEVMEVSRKPGSTSMATLSTQNDRGSALRSVKCPHRSQRQCPDIFGSAVVWFTMRRHRYGSTRSRCPDHGCQWRSRRGNCTLTC